MTHNPPMLADFVVRLSFGLAVLLPAVNWRGMSLTFFRTQCQIILGLLVLASLDGARAAGARPAVAILVAAAASAYLATVCWGLGIPRLALPSTWLTAVLTGGWLALASRADSTAVCAFNTASRLSSGFLLGATLSAMLLGHHYLTSPTMSIEPLKRYILCIASALALRALLAILALGLAHSGMLAFNSQSTGPSAALLVIMRWLAGFGGPFLAAILAWKTAQIRSTQSATGILYAATALVLFGELSSLIVSYGGGLIS